LEVLKELCAISELEVSFANFLDDTECGTPFPLALPFLLEPPELFAVAGLLADDEGDVWMGT
jgi:hypothetical protein